MAFRETMKEWEEMANDYFKEMADSWGDFVIKSQEKACEQIPEKVEEAEETEDAVEANVVEQKSEKPASRRTASRKTASK